MKVSSAKLRKTCDPKDFGFETSNDLSGRKVIVDQKRALEALKVGIGVKEKNFNIFVAGEPDTGKSRLVKQYLTEMVQKQIDGESIALSDFCYVYNFENPDEPRIVQLKAGQAKKFKEEIAQLISLLQKEIPLLFETEEWKSKIHQETTFLKAANEEITKHLNEKAKSHGCVIAQTPNGVLSVLKADPDDPKQVISRPKFDAMTEEEQKEFFEKDMPLVEEELKKTLNELKKIERATEQLVKKLQREKVSELFADVAADLSETYRKNQDVVAYLDAMGKDIGENLEQFSNNNHDKTSSGLPFMLQGMFASPQNFFLRYEINIFVDNSQTPGVPIVVETNPTYANLFGKIKVETRQGVLATNFLNIKAGAVQKANGGYLIIPAYNLFKTSLTLLCWECLKRTIKDQKVVIDSSANYFGAEFTTLKPQPMPFSGKIILIGDLYLYDVLCEIDDQFRSIFKIKVELEEKIDRQPETINDCIEFLATFCKENHFLPFDKTAAGRLIDFLSELAGNQKKISLRLGEAESILKEADFWTREDKKKIITDKEIEKSLQKKEERLNLVEKHYLEYIKNDILKIAVDGSKIGQINGLSVISYADHTFGIPSRITAKTGYGEEEIVNVDRECDLAGNNQAKSVFVIKGYLKEKYGKDFSNNLSVSLCFEQNYSGVEGDSASAAELFAVISSIAEVPLRQNLAITGSMNQNGEIQAIGGINYKIKGFFKVCRDRGLTGSQGVIMPKDNLDELMLPEEILKAVEDDKFHIYAISTAEEGIEYLTGMTMKDIDKKIFSRKGLFQSFKKIWEKIF